MSDIVPQLFNRFGFLPNSDPIKAFCHATERHDPQYRNDEADRTAAGDLVHVLWSAFDATSVITVRHGDEVMHLCLYSEVAVYDSTLYLGPFSIDLESPNLQIAPISTAGFDFVLDGTPLRLTHAGRLIDATYHFAQHLTRQVLRMWTGEISHILVTRGDRSESFDRDAIRIYDMGYSHYAVRLGNMLMVRPDRGSVWNFEDGVSDGIDLDGVPVRIEVVPTEGHTTSIKHCVLFDGPIEEVEPRHLVVRVRRTGAEVAAALIGTQVLDDGEWPGPTRSTAPRRGLGRQAGSVAQAA